MIDLSNGVLQTHTDTQENSAISDSDTSIFLSPIFLKL